MKGRYILTRFLISLFTLWVVATVTFVLMKAIPGDPFTQEEALPPEILAALYAHYRLDDPWYMQYLHYLHSIVTWDFGPSFKQKTETVNDIINRSFPISATIGTQALFLALSCGILLGSIAALKQNHWQDYTAMLIAVIGVSVPSFIFAATLQYLLAIKFDLLPIARWEDVLSSVMPTLSLAVLPTAFIARLMRANMVEVLTMDYIKTARAKGVSSSGVIIRHTLRNSILPVVSYIGSLAANILTGSFVIEKIFGIPGLGQWFVNSVTNRDYTVIMGLTIFYSILLLTAIFLVDLLYCWIDPKIGTLHNHR